MILCTLDRVGRRYGWWFARGRVEAGALERFGGAPVVGRAGLHAAKDVIGALAHARSAPLCLVRLGGRVVDDADQLSATERAVVATFDVQSDLRPLVARWVERALASAHEEPELRDAETHRARAGDARARAIDADEIVRDAEWVIEEGRADAATMARARGEHLGASQRWAEARAAAFAHEAAGCLAEEQVTSVGRAVERLVRAEALLAELSESDDAIARAREAIEDAFREALAVEPGARVDPGDAAAKALGSQRTERRTRDARALGAGTRAGLQPDELFATTAENLLRRLLLHIRDARAWPVPLVGPPRSDYRMHLWVECANRARARQIVGRLDEVFVGSHVSWENGGSRWTIGTGRGSSSTVEKLESLLRAHARAQGRLRNDAPTRLRAELALARARTAGWVHAADDAARRCLIVCLDANRAAPTLPAALAQTADGCEHAVFLHGDPLRALEGDFLYTGDGRDIVASLGPDLNASINQALFGRPVFDRAYGLAEPPPVSAFELASDSDAAAKRTLVTRGAPVGEKRSSILPWRRSITGRALLGKLVAVIERSRHQAWIAPLAVPPQAHASLRLPFFIKTRTEREAQKLVEAIERAAAGLPCVGAFVVWGEDTVAAIEAGRLAATSLLRETLAHPPAELASVTTSPRLCVDSSSVLRAEMALAHVRAAGWATPDLLLVWGGPLSCSPEEVVARAREATQEETKVVVIHGEDPIVSCLEQGNFYCTPMAHDALSGTGEVGRTLSTALVHEPSYRDRSGLTDPSFAVPRRVTRAIFSPTTPPAASAWTSALATAVERSQLAAAVQLSPRMQETGAAVDAGCARCGARYLLPDGTPLGSTRCSGCGAMGLEGVTHGAIGETEPGRCPSCSAQLRAPAITAREHGPRYHVRCPACGQAVRPIPSAQPAPE